MRMKRMLAVLCMCVLLLCGCRADTVQWQGNVAMVSQEYLTQVEFDTWYACMQHFDTLMPEKLCDMLGINGALRDESALLAFTRYETIRQNHGEASKSDAQALLQELDVPEDKNALACALVYCSIDACRSDAVRDVLVTDEQVREWYDVQLQEQSALAQEDLTAAQENYVQGVWDVTVYVPEGLRILRVIGISVQEHGASEAFSTAQSVWRSLLYNGSFTELFAQYNEMERYAAADSTPKAFYIYDGWTQDADIARCAENLDKPGQMCGPTICTDACLIVRYDAQPASGAIAFELVEDQCAQGALAAQREQVWRDTLDQMQHDAQVRFAPHWD